MRSHSVRISALRPLRRGPFPHYAPIVIFVDRCKGLFLQASDVRTMHTTPALWQVGLRRTPESSIRTDFHAKGERAPKTNDSGTWFFHIENEDFAGGKRSRTRASISGP